MTLRSSRRPAEGGTLIHSYEAARTAVAVELGPLWGDTPGTFHVAEDGLEDSEGYLVPWGAREWLVDGDPAFTVLGGAITFVDKATGRVRVGIRVNHAKRIATMSPVR
ncbi:hypothetical protein [Microbacterium sp.]|uniref:hypothetical protein n=1 Tax=Microbacterium sp. TaxID=51671 RepID=UPI003A88A2EB